MTVPFSQHMFPDGEGPKSTHCSFIPDIFLGSAKKDGDLFWNFQRLCHIALPTSSIIGRTCVYGDGIQCPISGHVEWKWLLKYWCHVLWVTMVGSVYI